MITALFCILMIMVFGRIAYFAIRLTWGITKVLFSLIFLPLILLYVFFKGLVYLAFPALIIIGIISLLTVK